jgi:hypothetical protein
MHLKRKQSKKEKHKRVKEGMKSPKKFRIAINFLHIATEYIFAQLADDILSALIK